MRVTGSQLSNDPFGELATALAEDDRWLDSLEDQYDEARETADEGGDTDATVVWLWKKACERLAGYQNLIDKVRAKPRGQFRRKLRAAVALRMERLIGLMRTMVVVWDELQLDTPDEIFETVWTIRIPVGAQL